MGDGINDFQIGLEYQHPKFLLRDIYNKNSKCYFVIHDYHIIKYNFLRFATELVILKLEQNVNFEELKLKLVLQFIR